MRVCPRYSHDAGPLYWRSGKPMHWTMEVLHYLVFNPLTVVIVLFCVGRAIWQALT